MVTLHLT